MADGVGTLVNFLFSDDFIYLINIIFTRGLPPSSGTPGRRRRPRLAQSVAGASGPIGFAFQPFLLSSSSWADVTIGEVVYQTGLQLGMIKTLIREGTGGKRRLASEVATRNVKWYTIIMTDSKN